MLRLIQNDRFTKKIIGLTPDESDDILDFLFKTVSENHDFQVGRTTSLTILDNHVVIKVRYKWSQNDIAIWDNRSALHTAT